MLGISYYKLYCPQRVIHPYKLTQEQAEFFNKLVWVTTPVVASTVKVAFLFSVQS